jgi:hypothetical protein
VTPLQFASAKGLTLTRVGLDGVLEDIPAALRARSPIAPYVMRARLRGFTLSYEAPFLRHFSARLEPSGMVTDAPGGRL